MHVYPVYIVYIFPEPVCGTMVTLMGIECEEKEKEKKKGEKKKRFLTTTKKKKKKKKKKKNAPKTI
jgi:hypothetical protein